MIKNENTSISSILDKDTIIGKIMKGLVKVYENFKSLPLSGIPPLTLPKCKGVPLLDYKIYGNSVQNGTPTPDNPIEVESVGDKTKNLFDLNKITTNGRGIEEFENKLCFHYKDGHTNFELPINGKENTQYTLTFKLYRREENKNKITNIKLYYSDGTVKNFIISPNKTYNIVSLQEKTLIKISGSESYNLDVWIDLSITQLEEGTEATEFEPYGYKIPITIQGKNLLDIPDIDSSTADATIKCNLTKSFTVSCQEYPTLIANNAGAETSVWRLQLKYLDGTLNYVVDNSLKHLTGYNTKFTASEDNPVIEIKYRGIYIREGSYKDIQIEYGSIATKYEPYVTPSTTYIYLDEPLRKVGDYADYIDFENGKVVRNIGKVVLDGSETDWVYQSNLSRFYKPITDSNPLNKRTPIISNRFISNTSNIQEEGIGFIHSSKIYLYCPTNITSITSFQTWLSTHNTEVVYELATPIEETIELPNIPTHKGTNIIEVDTSILPSNMEVVYKGKEV